MRFLPYIPGHHCKQEDLLVPSSQKVHEQFISKALCYCICLFLEKENHLGHYFFFLLPDLMLFCVLQLQLLTQRDITCCLGSREYEEVIKVESWEVIKFPKLLHKLHHCWFCTPLPYRAIILQVLMGLLFFILHKSRGEESQGQILPLSLHLVSRTVKPSSSSSSHFWPWWKHCHWQE